ncbi:MAG: hypothetical protein Q7R96_06620 [Nanoarchaeota archaeon]|nr:hypothetical protein [Nanoarchaeota archaeon]
MKQVHTMIERPVEIRRALLEAAIKSTEVLKTYESMQDVRDQKEEVKKQIRLNLVRLKRLVLGVKKSLPVLPKDLDMPHPVKPIELKQKPEVVPAKVNVSSRDRLDRDIKALQERIQKLHV